MTPGASPRPQRWLLYALGGGLGHLTRAIGLARRAVARGHRVTLLVNSPFARWIALRCELPGAVDLAGNRAAGPGQAGADGDASSEAGTGVGAGAEILAIHPDRDRRDVAGRVRAIVARGDFDALVVDTFPRGLGGELADLLPAVPAVKVLVHRLICDEYVRSASLREFVAHYDRILIPGEPAPLASLDRALVTAPWLVRDHHELLSRDQARRALGVPLGAAEAPLILVVGSGKLAEIAQARDLAGELRTAVARLTGPAGDDRDTRAPAPAGPGIESTVVKFSAPGHPDARWPLLPLLPGVDVVVGAGGYNTVHEARATSTPLVALARERLYDRQAVRLRPGERVSTTAEAVARTVEVVRRRGPRTIPAYENGTHAAVREIEHLCSSAHAA